MNRLKAKARKMVRTLSHPAATLPTALLAAVAMTSIAATPAKADFRLDIGSDVDCRPDRVERAERVWVEPVYRTVCDRVWVEGSSTTVIDRVWVPAVTQTVCDRVWVPERVENRDIVHGDGRHRWVEHVRVIVCPGHYEERQRQVEVTPGHYEDVQRQVCTEGHWQNVERRELVTPGHYEWRTIETRRPDRGGGWFRIDIGGRR